MDTVSNAILSSLGHALSQILESFFAVPTAVLSQLIQLILFTTAASSLIIYLFKLIRFEYAQSLTNNWIFKIIVGFIFFSAQIWNRWSYSFTYVNYFCSVIICLYMYDCLCNIGDAYSVYLNQQRGKFKQLYLILANFGLIGAFSYSLYLGKFTGELFVSLYYKQESNNLAYIAALGALILIINLIKGGRAMHGLLLTSILFTIIILRHHCVILSTDHLLFEFPVESIFYVLMAFDAQAKQSQRAIHKKYGLNYYLLFSCVGFYLYTLMNQRLFPIQLVFGLVALGMSFLNK